MEERSTMKKYVYMFPEGNGKMRELLGGKGANLAEMTGLGMPVPQGFTITTEACTRYYEDGKTIAPEIENAIVPINSMIKTINVCKSILFLPHFYTDISTNISSFCLKFYHKGFAFSIMLHMF